MLSRLSRGGALRRGLAGLLAEGGLNAPQAARLAAAPGARLLATAAKAHRTSVRARHPLAERGAVPDSEDLHSLDFLS